MQSEKIKMNDAPFPDFNGFHKSALQALGWHIIDGAVQVSTCATPTKPNRSKDRVGWIVLERILSKVNTLIGWHGFSYDYRDGQSVDILRRRHGPGVSPGKA